MGIRIIMSPRNRLLRGFALKVTKGLYYSLAYVAVLLGSLIFGTIAVGMTEIANSPKESGSEILVSAMHQGTQVMNGLNPVQSVFVFSSVVYAIILTFIFVRVWDKFKHGIESYI